MNRVQLDGANSDQRTKGVQSESTLTTNDDAREHEENCKFCKILYTLLYFCL